MSLLNHASVQCTKTRSCNVGNSVVVYIFNGPGNKNTLLNTLEFWKLYCTLYGVLHTLKNLYIKNLGEDQFKKNNPIEYLRILDTVLHTI